jgi:metal-sulfur cluster biosynthetic enzyme
LWTHVHPPILGRPGEVRRRARGRSSTESGEIGRSAPVALPPAVRRFVDPPPRGAGVVLYDGCMSTETLTEEDVYEALEEVIDPELGLDFVSLGLVYDVEIEGQEVFITFTLTTPACPIGPQVSEQMREFVGDLPGVEKVHPKMIFDPPWSPEMMSEDAKFALGF